MSIDDKMVSSHMEEKSASTLEKGPRDVQTVERVATVDIDNYHGIHLKTILVYMVQTFFPELIWLPRLTDHRLSVFSRSRSSSTSLDLVQ